MCIYVGVDETWKRNMREGKCLRKQEEVTEHWTIK